MRADVRIHESASESERDCLRPGVHAELGQDVLDVRGDSLRADDEIRRDLTLSAAVGEEAEDLALAWAEARVLSAPVAVDAPVCGPVRVLRCATQVRPGAHMLTGTTGSPSPSIHSPLHSQLNPWLAGAVL